MKILSLIVLISFTINSQTNEWKVFNQENSTLLGGGYYCLGFDTSQSLWLAHHALGKWDGISTISFNHPELGSDITKIHGSPDGFVWLSLVRKVIKTNGIEWLTYNFNELVYSLTVDKDNNVWVGSKGLYKFDGNDWTLYDTINSPLPYPYVAQLYAAENGTIWGFAEGFYGQAIFQFDGMNWTIFPSEFGSNWWGSTFVVDRKRNVYFGTGIYPDYGIVHLKDGIFNFYPSPFVEKLVLDNYDKLWICHNYSVSKFVNGSLVYYQDTVTYHFNDMTVDKNNNLWFSTAYHNEGVVVFNKNGIVLSSNEIKNELHKDFSLFQNYPNPFNPATKISWKSPAGGWQTLKVYDILGNEIATLVNEEKPAGAYEVEFNASSLSSGIYFYELRTEGFVQTRKMILMK